jgi:hypothetical protein
VLSLVNTAPTGLLDRDLTTSVTLIGTVRYETTLLFIANESGGYCVGADEEDNDACSICFRSMLQAILTSVT